MSWGFVMAASGWAMLVLAVLIGGGIVPALAIGGFTLMIAGFIWTVSVW
jgi:hypothetical protein